MTRCDISSSESEISFDYCEDINMELLFIWPKISIPNGFIICSRILVDISVTSPRQMGLTVGRSWSDLDLYWRTPETTHLAWTAEVPTKTTFT